MEGNKECTHRRTCPLCQRKIWSTHRSGIAHDPPGLCPYCLKGTLSCLKRATDWRWEQKLVSPSLAHHARAWPPISPVQPPTLHPASSSPGVLYSVLYPGLLPTRGARHSYIDVSNELLAENNFYDYSMWLLVTLFLQGWVLRHPLNPREKEAQILARWRIPLHSDVANLF